MTPKRTLSQMIGSFSSAWTSDGRILFASSSAPLSTRLERVPSLRATDFAPGAAATRSVFRARRPFNHPPRAVLRTNRW